MKNIFERLFIFFLDTLFPKKPDITRLEHMSADYFFDCVSRPIQQAPSDIHPLFEYDDPLLKKALWELKYKGNQKIARLCATLLYDVILEKLGEEVLFSHFTLPLLIPMPLSRERLRERGWSQTEMLARELEKIDNNKNFIVQTDILKKTKHTLPQTKLDKTQRLKNLKGCFSIKKPEYVADRNIILLDDVVTTGSTITEAKTTLSKAGAKRVIAFTLAKS